MLIIILGNGDWGIGDWGLGIGPNPQSPIPNPQWDYFNKKFLNYIIKMSLFNNSFYLNIFFIEIIYCWLKIFSNPKLASISCVSGSTSYCLSSK